MSTNQQNINLSEIDVQLNNTGDHADGKKDFGSETENTNSTTVDNLTSRNNNSNIKNNKYMYKAVYNNSNSYIIKEDNISDGNISIIKTKEISNSPGPECSQKSSSRCGRCVSSALNKHRNKCIVILACIAVVLFIIIIILISLLQTSSNEKEVSTSSACYYSPCLNNGTRSASIKTITCRCLDGFSGNWCEKTPCSETHCLNGGVCVIEGQSGICSCKYGFSGEMCEVTPCSNVTCLYGGICEVVNSSFRCVCPKGASGVYCEDTPCRKINCLNGGTCLFIANVSTCACPYGFYGKACEKYCEYGTRFYSCSFEDDDASCFLINSVNDDFNWTKYTGSTLSLNTGPTSAAEGDHYLYIEASPPAQEGHVARLVSNQVFSTCSRCLRFSYHMYGFAVGRLNVFHGDSIVWTQRGNFGKEWKHVFLDIGNGVNKRIIFEAVRGNGVTGDIAIDNVWFSPGRC